MLEANKSFWFENIFAVYNRNLLDRRFNSLRVSGLELLKEKENNIPLIIYANHSSWWDGLVAFQISRASGLDSYIMMEEKQLKSLRLFRRLGAFSVVRENPREALKSVKYAIRLLNDNAKRTLWIFPQGEILPNDARPLRFFNGTARIFRSLSKCSLLSAAFRYEFLGEFKPDIFVKFSKVEITTETAILKPSEISERISLCLTENLDQLKSDIAKRLIGDYERIY
jgi:chlorobactene lauroyltransferase